MPWAEPIQSSTAVSTSPVPAVIRINCQTVHGQGSMFPGLYKRWEVPWSLCKGRDGLCSLCFPLSFPSSSSLRNGFVVSWDSWVGVGVVGGVSWGSKWGGSPNPLELLIFQSLCSLCRKLNNAKGNICNLPEQGDEQLSQQHGARTNGCPNRPGYAMCLDKHVPIWGSWMPTSWLQLVPRFIQQLSQRCLLGFKTKRGETRASGVQQAEPSPAARTGTSPWGMADEASESVPEQCCQQVKPPMLRGWCVAALLSCEANHQ